MARRSPKSRSRSGVRAASPSPRAAGRGSGRGAGAPSVPQRLWAPWRLEFIHAPKPDDCIFCRFPAEPESHDRQNLLVHRSERSFAVLNRYPYNSGHLMVVPRAHVDRLEALTPDAFADLQAELLLAIRVVRGSDRPEGLNVGMNLGKVAGAGIADHLHWHVVPRWGGDTNFMPVVADVRVVPEALDATWVRLRAAFEG